MDTQALPASAPSLAYLAFAVRKPAAWARLLDEAIGLPRADAGSAWRIDAACHRLIVGPGDDDDLQALGLDAGSDAALQRWVARLRALGVAVEQAPDTLRQARRVQQLWLAHDPAGTRVELCTGLAAAATPFASERFPRGFVTGAQGLGHVALVAHDLAAMEHFYVDGLGFGVSERVRAKTGPLDVRGSFLHCNGRHHTIALLDLPLRQRIQHFMLQAATLADVGASYEHVQRLKVPLSLRIGQHPDPGGTFSYYAATPSGFDFEIGHGAEAIDPASWQTQHTQTTSTWGHAPTPRLQLKMATALVGRWARGPRRVTLPAGQTLQERR